MELNCYDNPDPTVILILRHPKDKVIFKPFIVRKKYGRPKYIIKRSYENYYVEKSSKTEYTQCNRHTNQSLLIHLIRRRKCICDNCWVSAIFTRKMYFMKSKRNISFQRTVNCEESNITGDIQSLYVKG